MLTAHEALSRKLRYVIAVQGLSNSVIATACGVTKSAVSQWRSTGRIDKRHFSALAEVSGYPEDWWLRDDAQIEGYVPFTECARRVAAALSERECNEDAERLLLAAIRTLPVRVTPTPAPVREGLMVVSHSDGTVIAERRAPLHERRSQPDRRKADGRKGNDPSP